MVRKRQAAADGEETRPIPPAAGKRNVVRVPPQNPRAQQRVAEVVRHGSGEFAGQSLEQEQRQRRVGGCRHRERPDWVHDCRHMILSSESNAP